MTSSQDWEIPRKIWMILASWGLAVLVIAGLLSFWIWTSNREAAEDRDRLQLEQDRAMCAVIGVFLSGPEPVPGPQGDRSRSVREAMTGYRDVLRCQEIQADPGPVRPGR